jgi:hypothetical protein
MTSTTSNTTTSTLSDYETEYEEESDYDSEDEPIQSDLEPQFKDIDFSEKLVSNLETNLSRNIIRWVRTYEYKRVNRFCVSGKIRKKPLLETKRYEKVRFIVKDTKYYSLSEVKTYNRLRKDDLKVLLGDRDTTIIRKDTSINVLAEKLDKMTNKFKWAMSKAFQHGFRYSRS